MGSVPTPEVSQRKEPSDGADERLVYVMAPDVMKGRRDDEIDLVALWSVLWRGKWQVFAVALLFAGASVAYALLATEWYRADVLLAPAEEKSTPSIGGQLGGLAALAGVSMVTSNTVEAVATLRSREFAREFIEDHQLLPVFFADKWDVAGNRWHEPDQALWPDIRDAIKFFQTNVLRVSEDTKTGAVTLIVEWTDPETAAQWADELVRRINQRLRERALQEAESNVAYLQGELGKTSVVALQQSIGRLLENELQKLMLARGNEEFAFRVIDSASVPKQRVRPKRTLLVLVSTFFGGVLGIVLVLVVRAFRLSKQTST